MTLLLAAIFSSAPAAAGDVLVPEATPASLSDFQYAYMVYSFVVSALEDRNLDVLDGDEIREFAGGNADACADSDECPANLWSSSDAPMAVVLVVGQADDALSTEVRYYSADQAEPVKVIRETVAFGAEVAFANRVAKVAADLHSMLPARASGLGEIGEKPESDQDLRTFDDDPPDGPSAEDAARAERAQAAARKAEAEQAAAEAKRVAAAKKAASDKKAADEKKAAEKAASAKKAESTAPARSSSTTREPTRVSTATTYADDPRAVEERRKMGIPWWDYARYRDSGMDSSAWLKKAQVRAGKGFVEVTAGYAMGDVDRGYGTRVALDENFASTGTSSWTGPGAGEGATGRLAVGYAPAWFLDTSVAVGLQGGKKYLNVGWECPKCDPPTSETPYPAVDATLLYIEPRARLFALASGYVKPYALAAFSITIHDGFHIPDASGAVDYADVDGGATFGPTFGIGTLIDPISPLSIVLEVPFTYIVEDASTSTNDPSMTLAPDVLSANGWVLRFSAGVGVRF